MSKLGACSDVVVGAVDGAVVGAVTSVCWGGGVVVGGTSSRFIIIGGGWEDWPSSLCFRAASSDAFAASVCPSWSWILTSSLYRDTSRSVAFFSCLCLATSSVCGWMVAGSLIFFLRAVMSASLIFRSSLMPLTFWGSCPISIITSSKDLILLSLACDDARSNSSWDAVLSRLLFNL